MAGYQSEMGRSRAQTQDTWSPTGLLRLRALLVFWLSSGEQKDQNLLIHRSILLYRTGGSRPGSKSHGR